MKKRTLVIHGAFGQHKLRREIRDWSQTVVVEVDARLPEKLRSQGAEVISGTLLPEPETAQSIVRRAEDLLDAFLEDKTPLPGLDTSRAFRSACLSLTGMRLVVPYVRTLLEAAEIMKRGPWERIIISPGAGVCTTAWQQVGRHFAVPVTVLRMDRQAPPVFWMLKRRFNRWLLKRRAAQLNRAAYFEFPTASRGNALLCVDPKLLPLLGEAGAKAGWRDAPRLSTADTETLTSLRQCYEIWWQSWWAAWEAEHALGGGLSDHEALRSVGDWMVGHVYAGHACALKQARTHLAELRPQRILISSILGMMELMWVLAARELGIQVVAYTLDDSLQPRLCFAPDIAIVEDLRQERLAQERGCAVPLIRARTHRHMPGPAAVQNMSQVTKRPQILLAASFYLGHVPVVPSEVGLWASELLVEAARQMPEADFAIKFHPVRERPDPRFNLDGFHHLHLWQAELHFQSLQPPANARLIMPEVRIYDLLSSTAVMLHLDSYAALEACSADVPVIFLSPTGHPSSINLQVMRDFAALKLASNARELMVELRALLADAVSRDAQIQAQQKFLAHFHSKKAPSLVEVLSGLPLP